MKKIVRFNCTVASIMASLVFALNLLKAGFQMQTIPAFVLALVFGGVTAFLIRSQAVGEIIPETNGANDLIDGRTMPINSESIFDEVIRCLILTAGINALLFVSLLGILAFI